MEIKEILSQLEDIEIKPDNLILAITKLIDIMHKNNLDNEAINTLAESGIKLEIKNQQK